MRPDPIDLDSPLGISKREWIKVLGVNLALLLIVYTVALVCTLCGSDLFLLKFHSDDLQRIENTLRGWNIYPLVQMGFATIEVTIVSCYVSNAKPKWWFILAFFGADIAFNFLFTALVGSYPGIVTNILMVLFWVFAIFAFNNWKAKEKWFIYLFRTLIALAITFILNGGITLFRNGYAKLWDVLPNTAFFALSIEYDLALILSLSFLTLVISWKGGKEKCQMPQDASGSSLNTKNLSPKPLKIATSNLPPKYRKRLRLLKVKVMIIQTIGLIVIAALPWFTGRPVEFALVYASFCITRLMLGFNRSLHFKSEMVCVTSGALVFWALTFLTPNVETSIILSLVYGAGLVLGFRLYWELHDLMMYHKAAKTDRYAMFYTVFKGNCDPKHINGVMRAKGYTDKDEIKIVQLYMAKEKVEYIAHYMTFAKITIEKKLTDIANDLYSRR